MVNRKLFRPALTDMKESYVAAAIAARSASGSCRRAKSPRRPSKRSRRIFTT